MRNKSLFKSGITHSIGEPFTSLANLFWDVPPCMESLYLWQVWLADISTGRTLCRLPERFIAVLCAAADFQVSPWLCCGLQLID